jgi:hypothetical protein
MGVIQFKLSLATPKLNKGYPTPNNMKQFYIVFLALFFAASFTQVKAQGNLMPAKRTFRVAVFAPLYLDSVFDNGNLKNSKSLPRVIIPGIDFAQGAMIAFDSMNLRGKKVEAYIFDAKANIKNIAWQIKNNQLDKMDLIIGSVREPEYSQLAGFALKKSIPFVSATFPNDGGVRSNPNLLIVNPTLKTHVESIYSFLLQKHGTDNIYLVKKKNDNRIENYFSAANTIEGKKLLKINVIPLDSSISTYRLRNLIDTSKQVVIIGASLDETFSAKLAEAIYPIEKNNPIIYMGMPNWDGFRSFLSKGTYPDFPIYFTTPHFDTQNNLFSTYLSNKYFEKYRTTPSDMSYKGFEAAQYFTQILINHPDDFMDQLNDATYAPFHSFLFRPIFLNKNNSVPDYYENKHLFIMKIMDGEISRGF